MDQPHPTAEKLYANLRRLGRADLADRIAAAIPLPASATDGDKAAWVRRVVAELDRDLPPETARAVMLGCHCGDVCRLDEMKDWLGGLYRASASLEEFVARVNAHNAGWYLEGGALCTKFLWCECHMLRAVASLPSRTWCHCTEGYTKALFEHVLGCEVDSELLQSIKTGHDFCLVKITPRRR